MMNEMTMGQRIAEQRKKLGISQEALGEKVGVSRQAISKWESDGAMPEIDKLIALSKLFGVSVGWLLGVEEQESPKPDELSNEQLKMVEEIVRRYQPRPEPMEKKFPWIVAICLFAAALAIAVSLFFPGDSGGQDYSQQISSLNSNYQSIRQQLSVLSGRVEDIASSAETADELLLTYEFQFGEVSKGGDLPEDPPGDDILIADIPTARITFTAVPKQHAESDTAWLAVLLEGHLVQQAECFWQGAGYTAEISLWLADGYEYRFVTEHPDGTQKIQVLEESIYSNLGYFTSLSYEATPVKADYNFGEWVLEVHKCYVRACKPVFGDNANAQWAEAGLILYRNGEEIQRRIDPADINPWETELIREYISYHYRNVKLEEGDELELTFYAALDNGMSKEVTIGQWTIREGKFTELEIAE